VVPDRRRQRRRLHQADRLAAIARRLRAHVNVIPMNPTPGVRWKEPTRRATRAFVDRVERAARRSPCATPGARRRRGLRAAARQLHLGAGSRLPAAVGAAERVDRSGRCPEGAVSRRRVVVLLGSTGSIGTQAIEVVRAHPDRFEVVGLAAGRDATTLAAQADAHGVRRVAVADPGAAALRAPAPGPRGARRPGGVASWPPPTPTWSLNGITGAVGLEPTLAALEAGTPVALANKESLIVGGDLVVAAAERAGGRESHLIPVDSEHSALAQCLRGGGATRSPGWC
jgi:hypothetical protein